MLKPIFLNLLNFDITALNALPAESLKLNIDIGENYREQFIEVLCHSDLKTMASFIYEMGSSRNDIIFQK